MVILSEAFREIGWNVQRLSRKGVAHLQFVKLEMDEAPDTLVRKDMVMI